MNRRFLIILPLLVFIVLGAGRPAIAGSSGYYTPVEPPLQVTVNSAFIKWTALKGDLGDVTLEANISKLIVSDYTTVSVYVDGVLLFSAPFWTFKALEDEPGLYQLKQNNLLVKLNLVQGTIKVKKEGVSLAGVNNSNGVEVKVELGQSTGIQIVMMTEGSGRKLTYAP